VILTVITITFFIVRIIPGGPFDMEREVPSEVKVALNSYYGFDKPLIVQYFNYVNNMLHGNFGPSYKYTDWDVTELVMTKAPISFELACYGLLIATTFGILFGSISAIYSYTKIDIFFSSLSSLCVCLPTFVLGPILAYIFAIKLHMFSVSGWSDFSNKFLPSVTLGTIYTAYISKLSKDSILAAMNRPYVITARAKGLSKLRIFFIHVLRNGLQPVIAFLGPAFASLISGAIVIETVFNIPGIGRLFINAISNRDDTLILGIVNFYALLIILFNTLADVVQVWLNPRQKLSL
jgi:oligopeptide transport system permease protein